ncbi:MAG: calcium/proton exchanger [Bryobacteraceae bacterium]
MLNWLLVFVPVAVALRLFWPDQQTPTFLAAAVAIIPLAAWMGHATEHLAEKTGEGIGGLLNATFGNAAELIIAIMALRAGLFEVVKASITGSIIGNVLLVLGAAFLAGGWRHKAQYFNPVATRAQATSLLLASIALIVPAAFHYLAGAAGAVHEAELSTEIAIVLMVTYALSLVFSLRTHKQLFAGQPVEVNEEMARSHAAWGVKRSVLVLAAATAAVAYVSEILVATVEHAADTFGMTKVFVGVIVVAVIGNAAEHSSAILAAMKNKMDLALGIAVGSSLQIAMFVAPLLVLLSYAIAPRPLDLVFTPAEVLAIAVSGWITAEVAADGESNWLEGVQLLALYVVLGLMFYFLPAAH